MRMGYLVTVHHIKKKLVKPNSIYCGHQIRIHLYSWERTTCAKYVVFFFKLVIFLIWWNVHLSHKFYNPSIIENNFKNGSYQMLLFNESPIISHETFLYNFRWWSIQRLSQRIIINQAFWRIPVCILSLFLPL